VRQPAALCGISGFKPTYGRVSRYGLVAFGSSLDQVSPLARSVRDLERALAVIGGHDPRDATSLVAPLDEPPARSGLSGLRVGVPAEYLPETLDAGVRARVEEALGVLADLGAETVPVRLPLSAHAVATYYVVATAEASSNLARFDGVRYGLRREGDGSLAGMMAATRAAGFGDEVKRRILLGTYVLSSGYYDAWYGRALRVRERLRAEFAAVFDTVDVLAGPTSPTAAFRLGERADDPLAMYLADVFTVPASLAGLPAVSVPCGFVADGGETLPVGLQLIGPRLADRATLAVARAYQEHTTHHGALPPAEASR
jgi:aspartyl-tRNA(Asn)/glutamyl-tRNA(Gln) amidotransferase subunit A